MPMASVVSRWPDLSDEDTGQCKPFADNNDGLHRVSVHSGVNMQRVPHEGGDLGPFLGPTSHPEEGSWLSHELRPHPG